MLDRKIIFLDCDGVINYVNWYHSDDYWNNNYTDPDIDPKVIERLNRLCDETGAKIVVSSSWKIVPTYKYRLEHAGLKNIIGKTPDFIFLNAEDYCRGWEIQEYLNNYNVDNYIILDDVKDFCDNQLDHFIYIDYYNGFTEDDFEVAKNMLWKQIK